MTGYKNRTINIFPGREKEEINLGLIEESPLSIRIQGKPHTVIMRTPGDETAHAAGFCLAEGIVDSLNDFATIGYCGEDVNVVTATLTAQRINKNPNIANPRGYVSQTSCGICGKELIEDIQQNIKPIPNDAKVETKVAVDCLDRLSDLQTRRHCSHAAAIFTRSGRLLSVGEDVGRHNALDKSIGKLLLSGSLKSGSILVLSSRISYELVQKAARAKIPVIFSVSGPTALAVELAESLNIAIVCQNKNGELFVFCGGHRLLYNQ